jgi:YidC/Oxa1 family membrane protein insertase
MISNLYHALFYDPLFNALVLLHQGLPWADVGVIVILLTLFVRLIIFPLSRKAVITQARMAEVAPELEKIKEQYKGSSEEQARKTLELYREKKINPFSGILVIIIQIPIVIALYQIFLKAGFPNINPQVLYSFVKAPEFINPVFLGLDLTEKSIILAVLAAIATFGQLRFSMKGQRTPTGNSFGDNLARSMQIQMKYFFPIIVFFISYSISGVIALYLLVGSLFTIAQEIIVRRKLTRASS